MASKGDALTLDGVIGILDTLLKAAQGQGTETPARRAAAFLKHLPLKRRKKA